MFGPIEGRRHDSFMLADSCLQEKLIHITKLNRDPYVVYGDLSYGLSYNIRLLSVALIWLLEKNKLNKNE